MPDKMDVVGIILTLILILSAFYIWEPPKYNPPSFDLSNLDSKHINEMYFHDRAIGDAVAAYFSIRVSSGNSSDLLNSYNETTKIILKPLLVPLKKLRPERVYYDPNGYPYSHFDYIRSIPIESQVTLFVTEILLITHGKYLNASRSSYISHLREVKHIARQMSSTAHEAYEKYDEGREYYEKHYYQLRVPKELRAYQLASYLSGHVSMSIARELESLRCFTCDVAEIFTSLFTWIL